MFRLAFDVNKTVMVFNNTVNHGEAQPGSLAGFFRGEKRLKNTALDAVVHSHAGVGNFDTDVSCCLSRAILYFATLNNLSSEFKLAAVRHRVASIHT